jgi:hypothetical protein
MDASTSNKIKFFINQIIKIKRKVSQIKRKGICYDVGRVMLGNKKIGAQILIQMLCTENLRSLKMTFCNTVRICGLDINRLVIAAKDALKQGLEIWFSPEIWDKNQEETLDYIVKCHSSAEKLRIQHSEKLVFSLGSELTIFMHGILEGNNFYERINHPSFVLHISQARQ